VLKLGTDDETRLDTMLTGSRRSVCGVLIERQPSGDYAVFDAASSLWKADLDRAAVSTLIDAALAERIEDANDQLAALYPPPQLPLLSEPLDERLLPERTERSVER
jgi:hypothetical protein